MDEEIFKLSRYGYNLPKDLIAQEPASPRNQSRLLVINRKTQSFHEDVFKNIINFLKPGDTLVLNNTKVIKARLKAQRLTGAKVEVLLLKAREIGIWEVLLRPAKRVKLGEKLNFSKNYTAEVLEKTEQGTRILKFSSDPANFL